VLAIYRNSNNLTNLLAMSNISDIIKITITLTAPNLNPDGTVQCPVNYCSCYQPNYVKCPQKYSVIPYSINQTSSTSNQGWNFSTDGNSLYPGQIQYLQLIPNNISITSVNNISIFISLMDSYGSNSLNDTTKNIYVMGSYQTIATYQDQSYFIPNIYNYYLANSPSLTYPIIPSIYQNSQLASKNVLSLNQSLNSMLFS
jgi:hypothetical protein